MKKTALLSLLFFPLVSSAQSIQQYISDITSFLFTTIIPFLMGIAFLFVVINVIRFFVIDSANQDGREKAKSYIIYSILGFILIILLWGIIEIIANATGLQGNRALTPDIPGYPASGGDCGAACAPTD